MSQPRAEDPHAIQLAEPVYSTAPEVQAAEAVPEVVSGEHMNSEAPPLVDGDDELLGLMESESMPSPLQPGAAAQEESEMESQFAAAYTMTAEDLAQLGSATPLNVALHDIFGHGFASWKSRQEGQPPVDPELMDTDRILLNVFGEHMNAADAEQLRASFTYETLKHAIQHSQRDDLLSEFDDLFGPNASFIKSENGKSVVPNVSLSAAFPTHPRSSNPLDSTVLMTMPTVYPNCQVLHFDPNPYFPSLTLPKASGPRKMFTAQNVMYWTYEPKSRQFLSNARVVQWSDGTTTLHVGAEKYAIETFTEAGLSFIGEKKQLYRCDKSISAMVETLPVDNHVTVRASVDSRNSIDEVTAAKLLHAQRENLATKVGLAVGGMPLPVGTGTKRTLEQEYVEKEMAALRKHYEQRQREGNPMSLLEQLEAEAEILESVRKALGDMSTLVAAQQRRGEEETQKVTAAAEERRRQAAERQAQSPAKGSKRLREPKVSRDEDEETAAEVVERRRPGRRIDVAEEESDANAGHSGSAPAPDAEMDWTARLASTLREAKETALDESARMIIDVTVQQIEAGEITSTKATALAEIEKMIKDVMDLDETVDMTSLRAAMEEVEAELEE